MSWDAHLEYKVVNICKEVFTITESWFLRRKVVVIWISHREDFWDNTVYIVLYSDLSGWSLYKIDYTIKFCVSCFILQFKIINKIKPKYGEQGTAQNLQPFHSCLETYIQLPLVETYPVSIDIFLKLKHNEQGKFGSSALGNKVTASSGSQNNLESFFLLHNSPLCKELHKMLPK